MGRECCRSCCASNKRCISRAGTADNKLHCNGWGGEREKLNPGCDAPVHVRTHRECKHRSMYRDRFLRARLRINAYRAGYDDRSGIWNVQRCIVDCGLRSEMNLSFGEAQGIHRLALTYSVSPIEIHLSTYSFVLPLCLRSSSTARSWLGRVWPSTDFIHLRDASSMGFQRPAATCRLEIASQIGLSFFL